MKSMKFMLSPNIIGLTVIACAMGFGFKSLASNLVPYIPFAQAKAAGTKGETKTVQIMGRLDTKSISVQQGILFFTMVERDDKGNPTGETVPVRFKGQSGPNFKEAIEVTAIGHYETQPTPIFIADKILTKCPSKYQGVKGTETKEYGAK